jgi:hypothetical protein
MIRPRTSGPSFALKRSDESIWTGNGDVTSHELRRSHLAEMAVICKYQPYRLYSAAMNSLTMPKQIVSLLVVIELEQSRRGRVIRNMDSGFVVWNERWQSLHGGRL